MIPPESLPPARLVIKLRRARRQLRQLRKTVNVFAVSNKGEWRRVVNQEKTHYLYSLYIPPGPPAAQLLADEAVHHLRSLLDQLITAIIEARGGSAASCQFPIRDTQPKSDKEIATFNASIAGVPDWARDLIIAVQPYQRENVIQAHRHPLWLLNRLDNRFKHTSLDLFSFRVQMPNLPGVVARARSWPSLQRGDVFAQVPVNIDVQKDFEPHISVHLMFAVPRIGVDGIGLSTLEEIYNFVRDEILAKFVIGARIPPRL